MVPMNEVVFRTPRLIARRITSNDVEALLAVYGDADAMRWVGDGRPITRDECIQWVEVTKANYARRGYGMVALAESMTDALVGFIGLVHPGNQAEAEVKYALLRSCWGRGLATEAVIGILDYGRREHRLSRVIATTAPDNVASHRVLVKAGMERAELRANSDGTSTQVFVWHSPA